MSECDNYRELISAKIDDELDASESERLDTHLSGCERCRSYYGTLKTITDLAPDLAVDPPEMLAKGIMYKIGLEKKAPPAKKFFNQYRFSLVGLAAALLILVGVGQFGDLFKNMKMSTAVDMNQYAVAPENGQGISPVAGGETSPVADAPEAKLFGAATAAQPQEEAIYDSAYEMSKDGSVKITSEPAKALFTNDGGARIIGESEFPDIPEAAQYGKVAVIGKDKLSDRIEAYERHESGEYSYYLVSQEEFDELTTGLSEYDLYTTEGSIPPGSQIMIIVTE